MYYLVEIRKLLLSDSTLFIVKTQCWTFWSLYLSKVIIIIKDCFRESKGVLFEVIILFHPFRCAHQMLV